LSGIFGHSLALSRLLQYRSYVFHNAVDELRHRYAGTSLGLVWNVVVPLLQIVVYSVVFTQVMVIRMPAGSTSRSFVLYLCAGYLPWIAFMESVVRGGQAFVENAALLKRLPLPEEVFVAQAALSSIFSLSISLLLLVGAAVLFGEPPRATWLLLPAVGLLFQLFAFGLALLVSCLNLIFRDLSQLLPIVLQIWMWATPIVYMEDILPPLLRSWLPLNPAWPFVRSFQGLLLGGKVPDPGTIAAMAAWAAAAILLGSFAIRGLRAEIRDLV
jgi:lipopolysaccharide transport system permease protein